MSGLEFSVSALINAVVGGLVGGGISAWITWRWTRRKWERTAGGFRTTARYLARLILDPESVGDLLEDEKGWLRGFDQVLSGGAEPGGYSYTGYDAEMIVRRETTEDEEDS